MVETCAYLVWIYLAAIWFVTLFGITPTQTVDGTRKAEFSIDAIALTDDN